jgi:hypothetical protein
MRKQLLGGLVVLAIIAAGGAGVWYLRYGKAVPTAPVSPPPVAAAPAPEAAPALSTAESDAKVRTLLAGVSSAPELATWLQSVEDLVRRFTTAVSNVAEGQSPRTVLPFLAPQGGFEVAEREGRTFIEPKSYARYDTVARVVTSLDAPKAAKAWQELKPLIDRAYAEISRPGARFEQTLSQAFQHLLEVPVPEGEVEVVKGQGILYTYANPEQEKLSAAQKHLLRMGPDNARAIQAKLRELQGALALPTASR